MRQIGGLAGGVHHHEQMITGIGDHQIVQNPAGLVGEQGVAHAAGGQGLKIAGRQRLQLLGGVGTVDADLAHMGDVKQSGLGAGVLVFAQHAERVLHRHAVAGEFHHLAAKLHVKRVQRRLEQLSHIGHVSPKVGQRGHGRTAEPDRVDAPPLYRNLRD